MNGDQLFGLIMVGIFGVLMPVTLAFGIPLAKAYARKVEGRVTPKDDRTLAELEQLKARLGELEERLDFTERMLAQHREREQLPDGGHR